MWARWSSAIVAIAIAIGCGEGAADDASRRLVIDDPAPTQPEAAEVDSVYGPNGEVLESGERLAGLVLPRGLELVIERGGQHIFHSDAPLAKMQAFFGQRLITGSVDRQGAGAIYRDAVPRNARGGVIRLDVGVFPGARGIGSRIVIDELPSSESRREPAIMTEETRRAAEEAQQRLD